MRGNGQKKQYGNTKKYETKHLNGKRFTININKMIIMNSHKYVHKMIINDNDHFEK